ncbi:Hypothetical predicted protein [Mytilus galloprovincialis]|uniref:Endonuclease/exonuclease/phosphatase domain-containing protein n=1 Tax=Mytilus galloprovincialis TaxID=29158 RepID=A0A8B6FKG5_MYTGA|nr:Hypothetical predicted protein [Mytilus galloprovincialis]
MSVFGHLPIVEIHNWSGESVWDLPSDIDDSSTSKSLPSSASKKVSSSSSKQSTRAPSPLRSQEKKDVQKKPGNTSSQKSSDSRSVGRGRGGVTPAARSPGDRRLSSDNRFSTLIIETEMETESVPPPERSRSQETHLKESDNVSLKGYNMYSTFSKVDERAAGGSSIFVKDNVIHSTVQLTTDLQAVAIRLSLDKTITLCSIYIPPNSIIDKAKLKNLTDQLPSPFILMGDFNAHNPLWGSKTHNAKGKIIEDFVSQEGLCIFNDGSNTYLHPGNGSYSSIDITICDPSLLLDYSWRVHDDLCGSDHFPIVLEHFFNSAQQRVPRWKLDKADWSLFENLCRTELQSKMFETVQDPILTFNTVLTSIADRTIPKTSANPKHPSKPWFDDACDQAIGDRKKI